MRRRRTKDEAFIDRIIARLAQGFVQGGIINPNGKTDVELYEEIKEAVDKYVRDDDDIQFIIEHRVNILRHARSFKLLEEDDLSILFYALWVEHQLNDIVIALSKRKGADEKEVEALIRETSYRAKCSWLLRLLDVKPISTSHTKIICKLMELRNGFVHYKWRPNNEQVEKERKSILEQIEKTVKYLRNVENKHLYSNHKRKLHKAIRDNREDYKP